MPQKTFTRAALLFLIAFHPPINAKSELTELNVCMSESQGMQMAQRQCLHDELDRLEKEMNTAITSARTNFDREINDVEEKPSEGTLLPDYSVFVRAQEAWLVYRDAECAWLVELKGAGSMRGSMYAQAYLNCQLEMSRNRLITLEYGHNFMSTS